MNTFMLTVVLMFGSQPQSIDNTVINVNSMTDCIKIGEGIQKNMYMNLGTNVNVRFSCVEINNEIKKNN